MKYQKLILISLVILSALILIFAGCTEKSLKGKLQTSQPPSIFWAQVMVGDSLHQNPVLHWYSTDMDGVVLDYDYTVLLSTKIDSIMGGHDLSAIESLLQLMTDSSANFTWTIIHTDSASIPLRASANTEDYIDQFVFVRAMDEDSLFSGIIWKNMKRNNHPPTCYVVTPRTIDGNAPEPQWCLPETTSTWKGIRVAWVGKDSIDIPGAIQPDFEWNIRVYGPFGDSVSCDTMLNHLYLEFRNQSDTTSVWIRDKQKYLKNLQTGWYYLYARNRDDAATPSIPTTGYMSVYEPTWIRHPEFTKSILIANHSFYGPPGIHDTRNGELSSLYADSVRNFYIQLVEQAGYTSADYDWVDFTPLPPQFPQPHVPKSVLYNHKMVIILDTDWLTPLDRDNQEKEYSLYMNVSGMIWNIGRRSFDGKDPTDRAGGLIEFIASGDYAKNHAIAYNYFDLSSVYSQGMSPINFRQADFAGATPILGGFPILDIDTIKVASCSWAQWRVARIDSIHHNPPETTWVQLFSYPYSHGLIGVDNLVRRPDNSETIYNYHAINPDTSHFDNFPVAIRYDKGTFKTSYFAFPLYFIQQDQAQIVVNQMLTWFNPRGF